MSNATYVFHCYMKGELICLYHLLPQAEKIKSRIPADESIDADGLNVLFSDVLDIRRQSEEGSKTQVQADRILSELDKVYGGDRRRIAGLIPGIGSSLSKLAVADDTVRQLTVSLNRLLCFENNMLSLKDSGWKRAADSDSILPQTIVSDCRYLYDTLGDLRNNNAFSIEDKDRIDLFNNYIFCMLPDSAG